VPGVGPDPAEPADGPGAGWDDTHDDYKRNGTTDLFTALNIATGEVITQCRKQHTAADVLAEAPWDPRILRPLEVRMELWPVGDEVGHRTSVTLKGSVVAETRRRLPPSSRQATPETGLGIRVVDTPARRFLPWLLATADAQVRGPDCAAAASDGPQEPLRSRHPLLLTIPALHFPADHLAQQNAHHPIRRERSPA